MKNLQPVQSAFSSQPATAPQVLTSTLAPASAETSAAPIVDCANLLRGHRQAFITHEGCVYVLRLTRGNKLILTK